MTFITFISVYVLFLSVYNTAYSMDDGEQQKIELHVDDDSAQIALDIIDRGESGDNIKTMEELKQYTGTFKKQNPERLPKISIPFMANTFSSLTHNTDIKTPAHSTLENDLKVIKNEKPEKFKKFSHYVLDLGEQYNGDISAQNRKNKNIEIEIKKQSSSSTSSSPAITERCDYYNAQKNSDSDLERKINNFLELKSLEDEIRNITLEATRKTIEEKERLATRNAIIGGAATLTGSTIVALTAYLIAQLKTSTCSPCVCQNSPTPPLLPQ